MLFFANQDIPAQTELTFDYNNGDKEKHFPGLQEDTSPEDARKRKKAGKRKYGKGKHRGGAQKRRKKG
jgi:hypothetical protein